MAPDDFLAHFGPYLRVQPAPFVPEFKLYLAETLVPLWRATESLAGDTQPPPFWAFAWPGSLALARYLLDTPGLVTGKRVLDFGSGSGVAAIAAAYCGAAHVRAVDVDPVASCAQGLNSELNGVTFASECEDVTGGESGSLPQDLLDRSLREVDVVLAGDVCYEREPAAHIERWLRRQAAGGSLVLLAEPGRHYAPTDRLDLLAAYDVPTLHELESVAQKRTRLWRVIPC